MSKQRVPEYKRWEIVDMYTNGRLPPKHIVRLTQVPRRTVFAILRKWKLHGTVADLPRSGRPRKTTPNVDRQIVRRARRFPFETPRQVLNVLHVPASTETVRRRWRAAGIQRNVARHTTLIIRMTRVHIAKRLAWCIKHQCKTSGGASYGATNAHSHSGTMGECGYGGRVARGISTASASIRIRRCRCGSTWTGEAGEGTNYTKAPSDRQGTLTPFKRHCSRI